MKSKEKIPLKQWNSFIGPMNFYTLIHWIHSLSWCIIVVIFRHIRYFVLMYDNSLTLWTLSSVENWWTNSLSQRGFPLYLHSFLNLNIDCFSTIFHFIQLSSLGEMFFPICSHINCKFMKYSFNHEYLNVNP